MPRLGLDRSDICPFKAARPISSCYRCRHEGIEQGIKRSIRGSRTTFGLLRPEGIANKTTGARRRRADKDRSDAGSARLRIPAELRAVSSSVEEAFGFAETRVVSFADIYGEKPWFFDRQHPRDLFDVPAPSAARGHRRFVAARLCRLSRQSRPADVEVLTGTRRDISKEFDHGFEGMTAERVLLRELLDAQKEMIELVVGRMPEEHRHFLISFRRANRTGPSLAFPKRPAFLR